MRAKLSNKEISEAASDDSLLSGRAQTPIHPNQVVDGIKFIEQQDPTYRSSSVFEECAADTGEAVFNQCNNTSNYLKRNNTGMQISAITDSGSLST